MVVSVAFRVAAVLVLVLLFWLGLRPEPVPKIIAHSDKWGHFIGFAAASFVLFFAFPKWPRVAFTVVFMFFCGLVIELVQQWFLPRRMFDTADLLVDCVGIVAALVLYWLASTLLKMLNSSW